MSYDDVVTIASEMDAMVQQCDAAVRGGLAVNGDAEWRAGLVLSGTLTLRGYLRGAALPGEATS